MIAQSHEAGQIALTFAQAVVTELFDDAYALLSTKLQATTSPDNLTEQYYTMIAYGGGKPTNVELIRIETMEGWAVREANDLGWAYVAIAGEDYSEAVSVIVAQEGARVVIRWVEWGRP